MKNYLIICLLSNPLNMFEIKLLCFLVSKTTPTKIDMHNLLLLDAIEWRQSKCEVKVPQLNYVK